MIETLKNKQDFNNVYKNGKMFGNRDFTLRYIKNEKSTNRLGVVVSKKVSKKAVKRNKLRRQIKEYLSTINVKLAQGYDYLITVKPNSLGQSYQDLVKSLDHLFKKKGLFIN